jgi:hypothetical protein
MAMIEQEKAAAWLVAPRSSSSSTEIVASCVVGENRNTTAASVTMLRMKKNTPTLTIGGQMIGSVILAVVRREPAPSVAEASSKVARICCTLVEAMRKPWAR